jgi:hypothetical protein
VLVEAMVMVIEDGHGGGRGGKYWLRGFSVVGLNCSQLFWILIFHLASVAKFESYQ